MSAPLLENLCSFPGSHCLLRAHNSLLLTHAQALLRHLSGHGPSVPDLPAGAAMLVMQYVAFCEDLRSAPLDLLQRSVDQALAQARQDELYPQTGAYLDYWLPD